MGFDGRWVNLIMNCVTTVSYTVVHNNKELGTFYPSRGVRQGDPLSPYLFILCSEGLSALFKSYSEAGLIHGINVARKAPIITHILFADDCYIYCRANEYEAESVMDLLSV